MDDIELEPACLWRGSRDRGAPRREVTAAGMRISRGLYLSHAEETSLEVRCRAWMRLLPPDEAFGLETAARLLALPGPAVPRAVQVVLRPRPVLPQRRGLQVHVRQLTEADVVDLEGLRITSGAQLYLDLAARWPPEELMAPGDALLREGHMTDDDLAARLARADRVRGVVRAREIAPRLSGRAHSRAESLVRYSLTAADGWVVLRFAQRHLRGPWTVVERTRRTLLHRGWRP